MVFSLLTHGPQLLEVLQMSLFLTLVEMSTNSLRFHMSSPSVTLLHTVVGAKQIQLTLIGCNIASPPMPTRCKAPFVTSPAVCDVASLTALCALVLIEEGFCFCLITDSAGAISSYNSPWNIKVIISRSYVSSSNREQVHPGDVPF